MAAELARTFDQRIDAFQNGVPFGTAGCALFALEARLQQRRERLHVRTRHGTRERLNGLCLLPALVILPCDALQLMLEACEIARKELAAAVEYTGDV